MPIYHGFARRDRWAEFFDGDWVVWIGIRHQIGDAETALPQSAVNLVPVNPEAAGQGGVMGTAWGQCDVLC